MRSVVGSLWILSLSLLSIGAEAPADAPLPEIDGKPVVATVNGVPITLEAFAGALAQAHEGALESEQPIARQDPGQLLDRLIGIELVAQEAENIGLHELPEVRDAIEAYAKMSTRSMVLGRHAREAVVPDAERAEELYRERIREFRLDSILVESEEEATAIKSRIESGEEFSALAEETLAEGAEKPHDSKQYFKPDDLLPVVREALSKLEVGQVSSVIPIGEQFTVLRLIDIRHADDPSVREEVQALVLKQGQTVALRRYAETLRDQYTTVDEELFESLDYSADGPGLEAMLADERVLVEVEGGESIPVAELTELLSKKAFHGAEKAIEQGRFDRSKYGTLDDLRKKRAIDLEAKRLKIAETGEFRSRLEEYRKGILFNTFLSRAIDPSVKLDAKELERYFEEHIEEYSTPEMIRIDALAFVERRDAEAALDRLRNGADFQWMRGNASGQVTQDSDDDVLRFDGRMPVVTTALPGGVRKAVAGARTADLRFYAESEGPAYVLLVRELIPAKPQGLDDVGERLVRAVQGQKRQAALDEWVGQLRAASEIEIFGTGDRLLEALGMGPIRHD